MSLVMFPLSWNELHPILVHFPIALLLIAPIFVVLGAFRRDTKGRTLLFSALLLMFLGTAGTFAARLSGEAAGKSARQTAAVHQVLENHEELAEATSIAFSVLTIAFAAIMWAIWRRSSDYNRTLQRVMPLVFLAFYGAGIVLLVNTAHQGGRLTHQFGVNVKTPVVSGVSAAVQQQDYDKD